MWFGEKVLKGLKLMTHIAETLDSILKELKELKMLSQEMQALVDQVAVTDGVEASAVVALQGFVQQIVDLLNQISMSAEDRAKAVQVTQDMKEATDTLAANIPVVSPAAKKK